MISPRLTNEDVPFDRSTDLWGLEGEAITEEFNIGVLQKEPLLFRRALRVGILHLELFRRARPRLTNEDVVCACSTYRIVLLTSHAACVFCEASVLNIL